ncbi:hypothetical protein [Kordiimonas sp.]|uniref:hypothetical protein n=1 Tax=Kordiimonas sp. TaxID=1970157 RepID=UPI003A92BDCA
MAAICLNGSLLKTLIIERYSNGVPGLLDAWTTSERKALSDPPDRSTVYRWMKGQLPRSASDLLSLCSLLDIDPFSILTARDGSISDAIHWLLNAVQLRQWRQPSLSFLADLFGRQQAWPPPSLAETFYGRPWHVKEFEHDPAKRALYYACIGLSGSSDIRHTTPQVFHFAFYTPGVFGERWLQYGFVERYNNTIRLIHINGHTEIYEAEALSEPSSVETWFGPGHAVFRVASLHSFSLTQRNENHQGKKVRFPA